MGGMWLWWVVSLVALGGLVWWAVTYSRRGASVRGGEESAEAILKRRYAKGELEREEFQRRLQELRS